MPSYVIGGASRGLGYEYLRNLSADNSNIVIGLVRDKAAVEDKLARDNITNVHILQADLTDHKALLDAAEETSSLTGGSLDVLIVNGAYVSNETASLAPTQFIGREDFLKSDLKTSFLTNVLGPWYTINCFLSLIRVGITKKIIVISTGMSDPDFAQIAGIPSSVPYTVSKAGTNMLVTKYSIELKPDGIIVLALSPGLVNTKEKAPTPEELSQYAVLFAQFKSYAPDFVGPISPKESVEAQLKVIKKVTMDDSGKFLSHHGTKTWL
ncbi:hypothetical protein V500_10188 [Pseudogymnoascus sp. VKM F-4518 (FW-2643)]|nr:hypothetical protein V500_10188 [Pseudogymnoascus sp. VKM F-4518 (FW-2643)]